MRKNPTDPTMVGNLNEKVRKIEMNGKKQTSLGAPKNDHKPKSIFTMIPLILAFYLRIILRDFFRFLLKKVVLSSFSLSLL